MFKTNAPLRAVTFALLSSILLVPDLSFAADKAVKISSGDATLPINSKAASCAPTDPPQKVSEEKLADGYKFEFWCKNGFFQLKVILPNGKTGYLGKCPYPFGQNQATKVVSGDIYVVLTGPKKGTGLFVAKKLKRTTYNSFDAPRPPNPIPAGGTAWTQRKDSEWEYDVAKPGHLKKSSTTHDGRWMPPARPGLRPRYEAKNVKKIKTKETTLPRTTGQLTIASVILQPGSSECAIPQSEYALTTPLPVRVSDRDYAFAGVTLPSAGGLVSIMPFSATANEKFTYDFDFSDELGEQVRYELLTAPEGMELGAHNGVLNWIPNADDGGKRFEVSVAYGFLGQSGHIVELELPVLAAGQANIVKEIEIQPGLIEVALEGGQILDVLSDIEGELSLVTSATEDAVMDLYIPTSIMQGAGEAHDGDFGVTFNERDVEFEEPEGAGDMRHLRIFVPPHEKGVIAVRGRWSEPG